MSTIPQGYRLTLQAGDGTVLGTIELYGYNLDNPQHRDCLSQEVQAVLPSFPDVALPDPWDLRSLSTSAP